MKYLSRKELEEIAEWICACYRRLPEVNEREIYRIEPQLLCERVLGLQVDYQHLSLDGSILGLTSFSELGIEVFEESDEETFYYLDGKTILIERDLKQDISQTGRLNFTTTHEASHQIFKRLYPKEYGGQAKHRDIHFHCATTLREDGRHPIEDWEEWQANVLASAILLPKDLIEQALELFGMGNQVSIIDKTYTPYIYRKFAAMAAFLGVSKMTLAIRIRELGFWKGYKSDFMGVGRGVEHGKAGAEDHCAVPQM